METSAMKNQRVEKDVVRFWMKVAIKFGFDFKFVSIANRQYKILVIFLEPFDNFSVLIAITEFLLI